jgi:hypothetical protein
MSHKSNKGGIMRYLNWIVVLFVVFFFFPMAAVAGNLDSPAAPTNPASAMYTMQDVYNRINDGTEGTKRGGAFTEPGAGPAPTGKALDDLYDLASERSRVAKTGQTTFYETGDDGDLQKGVTWPTPRFTVNTGSGAGTVTDNLTGLMWAKDADATRLKDWKEALAYCNTLILGGHDDWRLPNVKELLSLIDFGKSDPALPGGHPFDNVQVHLLSFYGSSTTNHGNTAHAWHVSMRSGNVDNIGKGPFSILHVWPVRSGQ